MIARNDFKEASRDADLVKATILIRNYGQHVETVDEMWASVKTEHTLFDFNAVYPLVNMDQRDDDAKIRLMKSAWGSRCNALYPRYLDSGVKYGITFNVLDGLNGIVMEVLSKKFPDLHFLISLVPKSFDTYGGFSLLEYRNGKVSLIRPAKNEPAKYLMMKAAWGNEYSAPMAYDLIRERIVFLDQPEEQNLKFQQQHGLFYAAYVDSILDLEFIKWALKDSSPSAYDVEGLGIIDFTPKEITAT